MADAVTNNGNRLTIGLVCSHGGHLTEMLQLQEAFEGHETFYFCYDAETTRALRNATLIPNMARNPIEFVKNLFRSWHWLRRTRPDLLVSTGAEIALPVLFVSKLFRIPWFYVECGAQVTHPSFTGRFMYWLADAFHIQWPELQNVYGSRAILHGSLTVDDEAEEHGLSPVPCPSESRDGDFIYVTVGTMFLGFERLVKAMDAIAAATGERIVMQTGMTTTVAEHCECFDFKPHEETLALIRQARLVVCHAGIGCVLDVMREHRPLVVVPRLKRFNEHTNDHQVDLAQAVERRGWGRMVLDVEDLPALCAAPPPVVQYNPSRARLVAAARAMVKRVASKKATSS